MVPHYNLAFTISDSQSYKVRIERINILFYFRISSPVIPSHLKRAKARPLKVIRAPSSLISVRSGRLYFLGIFESTEF